MLLKFGLPLLTAILLILASPKPNLAFLAPFALAPLLHSMAQEASGRRRFLIGWLAGMVYWAGACYWIQGVLEHHAGMAGPLSWVGFVGFFLYKGLHMGGFAWLAGPLMRSRWALAAVPALWVVIERTHAALGFTWLLLGNAAIDMGLPLRLAPFTGVWGISFLFAAMATAITLALLRRPRFEWLPLAAAAFIVLLPAMPEPEPGTVQAVLVQPNIPGDADWTQEWVDAQHRRLVALSMQAALKDPANPPELIVWPEVPAPVYYEADPQLREAVNKLAGITGAHIVLNTVPRRADGMPLNSALVVSPEGRALARYDKINLVPFGEFVPWPFKALVDKVSTEAGDFAPGDAQILLPVDGHNLGAFVCYESVFPGFVRRFAALGAGALVNISNDGWYGASAARDQHLLIARMRAAESRRWMLRATNDGITSTIDPAGRAIRHLPSFEAGAVRTAFNYIDEATFYSRHGNWFVWLCAAVTVIFTAETQRRREKRKETEI
ncbi:MAG TPA: apolipoprotein N-acyltransferase [Bryobacteraceae bacterium]|nr:apolipoprotein N-acyltransferase [Bryobacteraceae bacterium]